MYDNNSNNNNKIIEVHGGNDMKNKFMKIIIKYVG